MSDFVALMIHEIEIPGYTLKGLAEKIGDLRYDALADFLNLLSEKIDLDGFEDESRGRAKLATALKASAASLKQSSLHIDKAWQICEPFMK
jgi:signal transduction histidine kinase